LPPSADARRGFTVHPALPLAPPADLPAADAILEGGTAIGRFLVIGLLGARALSLMQAAEREYRAGPATPTTERNLAAIATWLEAHATVGG
jgi:hypothetical protein